MARTVTCVGKAPEHVLMMCHCEASEDPVQQPQTTPAPSSISIEKQGFADDVWDDFGLEYTVKSVHTPQSTVAITTTNTTTTSKTTTTTTSKTTTTTSPTAKPSIIDPSKVRHAMVTGSVAAVTFLGVVAILCFTYKRRRRGGANVQDLNTAELSMTRFRSTTSNESDDANGGDGNEGMATTSFDSAADNPDGNANNLIFSRVTCYLFYIFYSKK